MTQALGTTSDAMATVAAMAAGKSDSSAEHEPTPAYALQMNQIHQLPLPQQLPHSLGMSAPR